MTIAHASAEQRSLPAYQPGNGSSAPNRRSRARKVKTLLVTGSNGLIGSEMIKHFDALEWPFAEQFIAAPRIAEVYNIGGGRGNSCSILEAFERVEALTGKAMRWEYVDNAREGDHICYISNLGKIRRHYPNWNLGRRLDDIVRELVEGWEVRSR
jgi:hypothetical protein